MFVDASAIVAILTAEPEADTLIDRLERAIRPITSPVAIFEATLGLCRKTHVSVEEAETDVTAFLAQARVTSVPVHDATSALQVFSRYGKGRGHPAQLNMGDCFAYAAAKNHRTTLLYKGDDFAKTDLA